MPHCLVEHSNNLDSDLLVQNVFSAVLGSGLFESDGSDIKVRGMIYGNYLTGPNRSSFIHVVLKILSGRTPEQKSYLSNVVIDNLVTLNYNEISITVEVVEIDRDSYGKVVK